MANKEQQIAESVKNLMESQGFNLSSLSEETGIPYNTLKRRTNTGRDFKVDELSAIAEALGMEFVDLITVNTDHKQAA